VEELIKLNPRYELQLEVLKQEYGIKLLEAQGEKLNPYNHARGAKFTDASCYSKAGKYYQ
jgi:hypothetical protein